MAEELQIIVGNTPIKVDWAEFRAQRRALEAVVQGDDASDGSLRDHIAGIEDFLAVFAEAAAEALGRDAVFGREDLSEPDRG